GCCTLHSSPGEPRHSTVRRASRARRQSRAGVPRTGGVVVGSRLVSTQSVRHTGPTIHSIQPAKQALEAPRADRANASFSQPQSGGDFAVRGWLGCVEQQREQLAASFVEGAESRAYRELLLETHEHILRQRLAVWHFFRFFVERRLPAARGHAAAKRSPRGTL